MPGLLEGIEQSYPGLLGKLAQTWPAKMAQGLLGAATLPGDVYQGNVSMYGEDGRTNPEVIGRSADLAGMVTLGAGAIPAEANSLRAGMGAYDPTKTGWVFRDVKAPHNEMAKGDWRAVTNAADEGRVMNVELPIRSMYATQKSVNPDFAEAATTAVRGDSKDLPFVIKKNGQYFVQDGHHRLTAAAERGSQTASVRLVDLDGTTQTQFPLIDMMGRR